MANDPNFSAITDRLPPQNIEAEEAILGGILLDPEAMGRVVELLRPECFAISSHQTIYRAILQLHAQGKPTDLMTVTTWLADQSLLEKVGGQLKLAQLIDRTVSAVNIDQYAALVVDKHLRRTLIHAGHEIVQLGYDTTMPLETVLDQSEQKVFSITQERPQQALVPISETLIATFQDIESRHEGIALPGIPCGFYDLDAMTGGFQRSDLIIVAGRPSMGKCLAADAEIVLADGSIETIETLCQHQPKQILTLNNNGKLALTQPSDFIDDGMKPVFRVTTKLGKFIETTITHPYLTIKGWQPLRELKPGDRIAVPRIIPIFGSEELREHQVKLLGYLMGDGSLTGIFPQLTHTNPKIQADFKDAVQLTFEKLCGTLQVEQNQLAPVGINPLKKNTNNPLILWLKSLDLWGKKIHEKVIPSIVFKLKKTQLSLFLNRLFATDGWAFVLANGQAQLGYATVNEKMARQVQHLLLRFGIIGKLKKRSIKYRNTERSAWQIDITDVPSIKIFISEIGILGKEVNLEAIHTNLLGKRDKTNNNDLVPREIWSKIAEAKGLETWGSLATKAGIKESSKIHIEMGDLSRGQLFRFGLALDNLPLQELAASDIYWDEIVAIEFMGNQQVYDLTIPGTHNFIANDICVHNTSFALNIGHNIAGVEKLPIAVFSLEMSKEQLVQRLLSSEARIESNRLRAGRISQNEWEPLSQAIGTLAELPVFIDDTPNLTIAEMRSKARRLQAEQGGALGLILLDYLQLMEGSSDNRVQELSRITRSLKGLARELCVPIIALSQLSRSVESRTNKRPMMSDLRESGSIEQDADLIIMLYREEYYQPDTPDRGIAEVIITKHRNGPTGTIKLLFDSQFTLFRNLAASRH